MTKLSQLKIDPEFQKQINPPSFEETHQLEMNILKEERVLNPIITWNGYIVDGHTRYQILRKYPFIPFEVIEKEFSSRYEALVWICKNQLGRRNLTPEQKHSDLVRRLKAEGFSDPSMLDWTFENDNGRSPQMHHAHRYVEQWQTMHAENLGLLLWGSVGTGKSFLAGSLQTL